MILHRGLALIENEDDSRKLFNVGDPLNVGDHGFL